LRELWVVSHPLSTESTTPSASRRDEPTDHHHTPHSTYLRQPPLRERRGRILILRPPHPGGAVPCAHTIHDYSPAWYPLGSTATRLIIPCCCSAFSRALRRRDWDLM